MIEMLNGVLPTVIYSLLVILIILLIVICIKALIAIRKVEKIITDVEEKISILNRLFGIVDIVTDKLAIVTETISDSLLSFIKNFIKNRKKRKELEESEDE